MKDGNAYDENFVFVFRCDIIFFYLPKRHSFFAYDLFDDVGSDTFGDGLF
jgi:hypothetical protein